MRRRQFFQAGAALGALGALGALAGTAWAFPVRGGQVGLPDAFDEIDHFEVGHAIRDGRRFPMPAPTLFKDVVVVGGGVSGLTALYRLADQDCLLLEKEPETGGNSRRRRAHGIQYPLGAFLNEGPIAPFTGFFDELDLDFLPVPGPRLAYALEGRIVPEPLEGGIERLPLPAGEREAFARAAAELRGYLDPREGIFFPRADNPAGIRALDDVTLAQFFRDRDYPPSLRRFLDQLVSSRLGDGGAGASAWIGLYLLSRLLAPSYTFAGGHGLVSERLTAKALAGRPDAVLTGVTVTRVEDKGDRVWVAAVDRQGEAFTVEARCAVLAIPKMITKRVVVGLAEARPGLYDAFRYNAYLVGQVELRAPVSPAFEVAARDLFTRFVVAPDRLPGNHGNSGRGHLTVYVPYPGVAGRVALYSAEAREIARRIVADLGVLFPDSPELIDRIRLHRWGHPMITPQPGLERVLEQIRQPFGNVIFAHSDTFGITGLYSAVWTGMDAYSEVLLRLMDA